METDVTGLKGDQRIVRVDRDNPHRKRGSPTRRLSDWTSAKRLLSSEPWSADLVVLATTLQQHDLNTWQHSQRVAKLVSLTCRALRLPVDVAFDATLGGLFHDIGKLSIACELLQKTEPLNQCEFALLRHHPDHGARLIAGTGRQINRLRLHIIQHHERWDGTGYPAGLERESIALESRIIALCDAYDSQTDDRPYSVACSHGAALLELQRASGSQFDPAVVSAFTRMFD